jgi:hypothetical protein
VPYDVYNNLALQYRQVSYYCSRTIKLMADTYCFLSDSDGDSDGDGDGDGDDLHHLEYQFFQIALVDHMRVVSPNIQQQIAWRFTHR